MPTPYSKQLGLMAALAAIILSHPQIAAAAPYNGFDLSNSSIPPAQIHRGGPPRDGIPAIDDPKFIAARQARRLMAQERVLGLNRNGVSKAYPIAIMNWHEIVNDEIGGEAVVVTFCPLCGTGVAFSARAGARQLNFGVSGLLYNSDVLLYDRQTESLWSQLLSRAVSGPMRDTSLQLIALEHTTWGDWHKRHPDTLVLSRDTGYGRDYERDPYAGYEDSRGIYFPVTHRDPRYHPKERVLGIEVNGQFKAYPFAELSKTDGVIRETFNGVPLEIHYDRGSHSARALDANGESIPAITAFWFAWTAFHPETDVFKARRIK